MESLDSSAITHGQMIKAKAENVAEQKTNVYIWDMDETLILLKSLLNGTYAASFNGSKDVQKGIEIGKRWENHILQVCDEFFFYEQIENYNQPFLDVLREYDDGKDLSDYDFSKDGFCPPYDDPNKRKLAYRHRVIAQKYAQGLHSMLNQEMIKLWDNLYESTDAYTDKWLSSARNFLEMLSRGNRILTPCLVSPESATDSADVKHQNLNVLVTSGSLIPSLVKCLLFRLDDLITHGNVYSSWEVGKLQCFSWIKERFSSPGVQFCVIGDGMEECEAAQMMKWPFIRIDPRPDGSHRFPGLSMKMVSHYLDVIYSTPDNENDNKR
ncbi:eyes absent homolog isoform X1 [Magnolia sinica]|uniref:eyes absent homolog isoform X1 n=1 Tax=Magnolia sinica TaxID=86752 RepID=UPI00265B508A|nr:eyes absent homolog isoform X1 [Magnolia sinica]